MNDKQYTIKDIASMAGVSAGTVDRVLHNRGAVSKRSQQKVREVLEAIHYEPNMFAIGLACKKKYLLCCLVPNYLENDYWNCVVRGIRLAADELNAFNVRTEFVFYDHSGVQSYKEAGAKLLEQRPDAVLIAPNFMDETLEITRRLDGEEIPYTLIDVNIEAANAMMFIGQNSYRSGYIAAKVLMDRCAEKRTDVALFMADSGQRTNEVQMQHRVAGFMNFVNGMSVKPVVHEVRLKVNDPQTTEENLDAFFASHPQVRLGVVFNSRVYQVAEYLERHAIRFDGLIGYDLLASNVDYLNKGVVTLLIGQRPALQGYRATKVLADKVVFKKEIPAMKYMPIDLVIKENIEYYVESYII